MSVTDLEKFENKDNEQVAFLQRYHKTCPVIDNGSAMNLLCHYMESVKDNIKINIKDRSNMSYINSYKSNVIEEIDSNIYNKIYKVIKELKEVLRASASSGTNKNDFNNEFSNDFNNIYEIYKNKLFSICSNQDIMINCLIDIFYIDFPSYNKDILWNLFGDEIFNNVVKNSSKVIDYPVLDENGDILYLGKKYKVEQFNIKGGDNQ